MRRSSPGEDGVSPVVGVMLMLSVTVMIAAIVSTYAGGLGEISEKAPQSTLSAKADLDHHPYPRISFDHNGGDPFSLDDIQVTFRFRENKTTIKKTDVGIKCENFTQIGVNGRSNENTLSAGDTFYLDGMNLNKNNDNSEIVFGKTTFSKDQGISWIVVDVRSSKTISMGTIYL